ncbi:MULTISPECIES: Gfo/Idh/MocA family protein [Pectobacterium]|uniref:Gfo/Idh/MocA family protein n=1 Tax=Pectobacterium TaxID=122277 RepID=UPI0005833DD3|nr:MULTISPECIES: Gfo/Idh/MocA family oxidoreductase [Pectobacterium]KHS85087.1 hypothetical protein RC84_06110 [Pectobacterium carotovorum subsp. carotovorum]MDE8742023.1 Gfo/Idh/MocA family oxidoreductase [Pectobacterium polaris]
MNRFAVIGLGSIAKRHIKNLRYLYPQSEIIAVSSRGKVDSYSKDIDVDIVTCHIEEAVDFNPTFAIIASPSTFHISHALFFLKKNIPVLIEKPVASNLSDIELLKSCDIDYEKLISVGYCLRYLPAAKIVKDFILKDELGKIYNVYAEVGQFLPTWRSDKNYKNSVSANKTLGGGALLELSHELDMVSWLVGDLEYLHGYLRNTTELNLKVEEIADLVLLSKGGAVCNIHLDFIQKKPSRKIKIIGEKGSLFWDVIENKVIIDCGNSYESLIDNVFYDKNNMYIDMISDFFAKTNNHENSCITFNESLKILSLIDKVKEKSTWTMI